MLRSSVSEDGLAFRDNMGSVSSSSSLGSVLEDDSGGICGAEDGEVTLGEIILEDGVSLVGSLESLDISRKTLVGSLSQVDRSIATLGAIVEDCSEMLGGFNIESGPSGEDLSLDGFQDLIHLLVSERLCRGNEQKGHKDAA